MALEYCFHIESDKKRLDERNSQEGAGNIGKMCICELKRMLSSNTSLTYDDFRCVAYYSVSDAFVYHPEMAKNCPLFTTDSARAIGDFTALMKQWK